MARLAAAAADGDAELEVLPLAGGRGKRRTLASTGKSVAWTRAVRICVSCLGVSHVMSAAHKKREKRRAAPSTVSLAL